MDSSEGSGGPPTWRFGSDSSRIPIRPSVDQSWSISPELTTGFKRVAEACSNILTKCKRECQKAKCEGSIHALESMLLFILQHPSANLPHSLLSQEIHHRLTIEERPGALDVPPEPHAFPSVIPPQSHSGDGGREAEGERRSGGERGWEKVDAMYTDVDFRIGCYIFTQFYKQRTREIRLAYVCGFRDALSEILDWASTQALASSDQSISREELHEVCSAQLMKLSPEAAHNFSASLHQLHHHPSQDAAGEADGEDDSAHTQELSARRDLRSETESVCRSESELDFSEDQPLGERAGTSMDASASAASSALPLAASASPSPLSFAAQQRYFAPSFSSVPAQAPSSSTGPTLASSSSSSAILLSPRRASQVERESSLCVTSDSSSSAAAVSGFMASPHAQHVVRSVLGARQPSAPGNLFAPRFGALLSSGASHSMSTSSAVAASACEDEDETPSHWVVGGKRENHMDISADTTLYSPRETKRSRFNRRGSSGHGGNSGQGML